MPNTTPLYRVFTRNTIDFTDIPKADISCYQWTDGYTPQAFAQLIFVRDIGFALHMEAMENHPKADCTMYNQPVYKDSCLEFFVNFNPSQPKYLNFEMNANGAFLSALRLDRKQKTPIHELLSDLPAVRAQQYSDRWTVDAVFTLQQLQTLFGKSAFAPGDTFIGNFYKCGDETPIPHFGMWSPIDLDHADFHQPSFFGTFQLEP